MTSLKSFWAPFARVILPLLLLLPALGCDGGGAKTVDFSKTMQVAQPEAPAENTRKLRMAVAAMISPKDTFEIYRQLLTYISGQMGAELEFVQRKTYAEVNELLQQGAVDVAFICSGPYASGKQKYGLELLATPEVRGSHFYHSYLIVGKDSPYKDLADLKGRSFAFTDPDSNTGRFVPLFWLSQLGQKPETFFSKTTYTYSHDNSILAVARGLVDAAAVDSLIWEFYARTNPEHTAKTRIIKRSEGFGIPPVVASGQLDREDKDRLKSILLAMHESTEGRRILAELSIDRFVVPSEEWYVSIRELERKMLKNEQGAGNGGKKP